MNNPLVFVIFFSCCLLQQLRAQKGINFIGLDVGIQALEAEVTNSERIRADVSASIDGSNNLRLRSNAISTYGGLRIESFLSSNKFSFSTGLYYAQRRSEIVQRAPLFSVAPDYFFYSFREDGVNTDFVTLEEMVQTTDYLTIPLRVRYSPLDCFSFPEPR
jgi:hypothetical protein